MRGDGKMTKSNKEFILQMDSNFGDLSVYSQNELIEWLMYNIDKMGCKVDTILWETHPYLPAEDPSNNLEAYEKFAEKKIDMMKIIIDECHKRGIKSIMHCRASEVNVNFRKKLPGKQGWNKLKLDHPDWVIKTWYPQGHWNFARKEFREFKINYIFEIMSKYEFDGICMDFSRHLPLLPIGRQWELREELTQFMRDLKKTLAANGKTIEIGAKVPENQKVCRDDGFDIQTWIAEELVDFFVIGSRSIYVEVDWYKSLMGNKKIKLYPCWDTWHSGDAQHCVPKEFYRGLILNWFGKGADGVVAFNFSPAPAEFTHKQMFNMHRALYQNEDVHYLNPGYEEIYQSFQEAEEVNQEHKFAVDRRGGYPYLTGNFTNNTYAQLPMNIPNDGTNANITIEVYKHTKKDKVKVILVIFNAKENIDNFRVYLNGVEAEVLSNDFHYIDRQIFSPDPQPNSGRAYCLTPNPSKLLRIEAEFSTEVLKYGDNVMSVCVVDRTDYLLDNIIIERAEIVL